MFGLMGGGVYYVSNRFALFLPLMSFGGWLSCFGGLTIVLFVLLQILFEPPNLFLKSIYKISAYWLIIMLYLFVSVLLIDFIGLFIWLSSTTRWLSSLVITILCMIYGVINARKLKIKEITIQIENLEKAIKIVHISDIHLGSFWGKDRVEQIVTKIQEINPDVIFNTGDLYDNKAFIDEDTDILEPFQNLSVPHFFVYGNHDEYAGLEKIAKRLEKVGIKFLKNEIAFFNEIQIIGLNDMLKDENAIDLHTKLSADTIKSVLEKIEIDENKATIALHHRPDGCEHLKAKKVNLFLAGHTHGVQLFPFTLFSKAFFTYNKGLYKYKDLNIFVSQGIGTIFAPVRLGTRSEIAVINLGGGS